MKEAGLLEFNYSGTWLYFADFTGRNTLYKISSPEKEFSASYTYGRIDFSGSCSSDAKYDQSIYFRDIFPYGISSKLRILAFLLRSGFPGDFVWLYAGIVYPESVF